jgi:hypothetical protein
VWIPPRIHALETFCHDSTADLAEARKGCGDADVRKVRAAPGGAEGGAYQWPGDGRLPAPRSG